jgi:hypothetical protein
MTNTVSVLRGKQGGAFHAPVHYAVGAQPIALEIADVDGDEALDLVVVNQNCPTGTCGRGSVSVLLGDGTGSFGAQASFAVNTNPRSVAVGDFNGDGTPDLAVVNAITTITQGPGTVSILLGLGGGNYSAGTEHPAGNGPGHVRAADLDGDGVLDLAITNFVGLVHTQAIVTLRGHGDGSFGALVSHTVANGPIGLAVADLDGDGALDLVTAGLGDNVVSILFGDGAGGFFPHVDHPAGFGPKAIAVADLDADGALDLALTTFSPGAGGGTIVVLRGHGNGGFDPAQEYWTGSIGADLLAADFDGDGALDLAAPDLGSRVGVFRGRGDGTLFAPGIHPAGSGPLGVTRADFDADGKLDLAVVNVDAGSFSVFPGLGGGDFGPKIDHVIGAEPTALAGGDFDGDGQVDLAIAVASGGRVSIVLGNGDGTFKPAKNALAGAGARALVTGDFNGDGRLDVAVAIPAADRIALLLGNGDGTMQAKIDVVVGPGPAALTRADFNRDGKLDLAVANVNTGSFGPGRVAVLLGHGDGTFAPPITLNAGIKSAAVASGDFNGDGNPDLAVATNLDVFGSVAILLGHGDGSFEPQVLYPAGRFSVAVGVSDFNRDHHADVVVLNQFNNTATIFAGRGDGTFMLQSHYDAGPGPTGFDVGQFNSDGVPDLAVSNFANEIRVFLSSP